MGTARSLLRPTVLTVVLSGFAFVAFASAADRMTQRDPTWSRLVPTPFRAEAAQISATLAFADGDVRRAGSEAARAVTASPADAQAIGLLATAMLLSDDAERTERAFGLAGTLGWRDPVVQTYWLNARLQQGEARAAIDRFEAIVRGNPSFPATDRLLGALMADSEARGLLIERMGRQPYFARQLLAVDALALSAAVAQRADLLLDPGFEEQPLGCTIVEPMIEGLASRQMTGRARAVQERHCPV